MGRASGADVDLFIERCRGIVLGLLRALELFLEVGGEGLLLGVNILGVLDLGRSDLLIGGDSE